MSNAAREKTLVLMRHAKAEEGPGQPDHDRELSGRGRRDASAAGRWLRDEGLVPDLVICSTAVRTRQTWEHACHGGANAEFVEFRRSVYLGGVEQTLETIREDAGDTVGVLVVGHNPTMAAAPGRRTMPWLRASSRAASPFFSTPGSGPTSTSARARCFAST